MNYTSLQTNLKTLIFNILLIISFLFSVAAYGQNLVPNGSFENYSTLPNGYGQYFKSTGWSNVNGVQTGPPYASPDYFHTAGSVGNYFGQIAPNTGDAQMGFYPYLASLGDAREYLMINLSSPLVVGQSYILEFYLTNGTNGAYTAHTDNIGAHMSVGPLTQMVDEVINVVPQYEIPGIVDHDNYWQYYSYSFVATTAADHLTFGNFEYNANTTVISGTSSYIFIDDVSITPVTNTGGLIVSADTTICLGETADLNASNSSTYEWVDSSNPSVTLSTDSTLSVSPTTTTTYLVYGDYDTVSCTVNINLPPTINLGVDTTLCDGDMITLDATTSSATYLWQDNSTGATYQVSSAGTYYVDVTVNGCSSSDTLVVSYISAPSVDLGSDTTICEGDAITLDANIAGGAYLWNDGQTTPTINVDASGTYSVNVTIGSCSSSDEIDVSVIPLPSDILGNDQTLCVGDQFVLDATTPGAVSYQWQDNSTAATFNVTQGGTYIVEVDINVCTVIDSASFVFNPLPDVSFSGPTEGCAPFTALFENNSTLANNCVWQFSDGTTFNDCGDISNTFDEGLYGLTLTVTSSDGCVNSISEANYLEVSTTPVASFNVDENIIYSNNTLVQFINGSNNANSYEWDFDDDSPISTEVNPQHEFPIDNDEYAVTLWAYASNPNCYDSVQTTVEVREALIFYVPNTFTPDGDQINATFLPVFTSGFDPNDYHLTIFNRWGEIVFESYNASVGWDGTYGSFGIVKDGTYIWQIDFIDKYTDERYLKTGSVNVIR